MTTQIRVMSQFINDPEFTSDGQNVITFLQNPAVPIRYEEAGDFFVLKLTANQLLEVKSGLDVVASRRKNTRISSSKKKVANGATSVTTRGIKPDYYIELPEKLKSSKPKTPPSNSLKSESQN